MMRLLASLLLCLTGLHAQAGETRYFTQLTGVISPLLDYRPRGEIQRERALQLRHYRVEYDTAGRPTRIAYFHGEHPHEGAYFRSHAVQLSYSEGERSRRYFDRRGEPASMWRHYYGGGAIHHEHYREHGGSVELRVYDRDEQPVSSAFGATLWRGETLDESSFVQTQFAADGSPAPLTRYFPMLRARVLTREDGVLQAIVNIDTEAREIPVNGAEYSRVVFDFDRYGNELGWEYRDPSGVLVERPGDEGSAGYARWRYETRWREVALGLAEHYVERGYDRHGNVLPAASGVHATRIDWDNQGQWTTQTFLDDKGAPMLDPALGYAVLQAQWTARGERKTLRYLAADGALRPDGIASETFSYAEDGSLRSHVRFDASGERIKD